MEDLGRRNLVGEWVLREDNVGSTLSSQHCLFVWHCQRINTWELIRKSRCFGVQNDLVSCSTDLSILIGPTHFKWASFGVWMNKWVSFSMLLATNPTLPYLWNTQRYAWFSDHSSYKAEEDINLLDNFVGICNLFTYCESYQHATFNYENNITHVKICQNGKDWKYCISCLLGHQRSEEALSQTFGKSF